MHYVVGVANTSYDIVGVAARAECGSLLEPEPHLIRGQDSIFTQAVLLLSSNYSHLPEIIAQGSCKYPFTKCEVFIDWFQSVCECKYASE